MVGENLDFAIVVPENGVILKEIEFAERHRNSSVAGFRQKGQNAVCEEDAAVRRSFSSNDERSKTRIRKCNTGGGIPQYAVILNANVRVGQVIGACERGEIGMESVLLLHFQPAERIGQTQFLQRHIPGEAQQILEGRLLCRAAFRLTEKK